MRGHDDDLYLLTSFKNLSSYIKVDNFTNISALAGFTLKSLFVTKEKICVAEHN